MAIDEKALYETLGLSYQEQEAEEDPDRAESARQQETAGRGGQDRQDDREGSKEQENREDLVEPDDGVEDPEQEETKSGQDEGKEPKENGKKNSQQQTMEQRARAAESRRQAKQRKAVEEAVARERAAEDQRWKEFFATAGLKSPVDGKPITTREEYEAYQRAMEDRRIRQNLQKGQLLPEDIESIVRRAIAQQSQGTAKDETSESAHERAAAEGRTVTQEQVDAELEEIRRLDPAMTDLKAILESETGEAFRASVARGASFIEAFKLANFDRLRQMTTAETAKRAEQAALNKARSKDHLQTSRSSGKGNVSVPAEVKEMYRYLMPGKTDAEIQEHYNRTLRDMK